MSNNILLIIPLTIVCYLAITFVFQKFLAKSKDQQTTDTADTAITPPVADSKLVATTHQATPTTPLTPGAGIAHHAATHAETGKATPSASESNASTASTKATLVPEDHVLRRHYQTHVVSMLEAVTPDSADSVLHRHHEQLIEQELEACLTDPAALEKLEQAYRELAKGPERIAPREDQAQVVSQPPVKGAGQKAVQPVTAPVSALPEDSVLRRHYLSNLRMELETAYPTPADSVLRRHHQHLLASILQAQGLPTEI